jgi:hypothetical protein
VSALLEMYFRPNPLRLVVPWGRSQNVWAKVPSRAQARRQVVLVAHLDTHRTPWAFASPRRLAFFRAMTTLGTLAFPAAAFFYAASLAAEPGPWRWGALALLPVFAAVLALTWQPDTTPHTQGANDNASGVSVVLSLAARLAHRPPANLEVWLLCSGCEEVGSQGVQAWVARHRDELRGALGISIDNVGGAGVGVCYTSVEGMVARYRPSAELFGLAERIRSERPELQAYSLPFTTLHTDATCLMVNGVPSLSFVGLTPDGRVPHWHQASDTFDNLDPAAVERTEEFVWELLRRLDLAPGHADPA